MIRIIVRKDNAAMAANAGGAVLSTFKTIDVDIPELEALLRSGAKRETAFEHTQVVGVEVIP
jgi:hypothetical protein